MTMIKKKFYLAGSWIESTEKLEVFSPYDGTLIGVTSMADRSHLETAIEQGVLIKHKLKQWPSHARYETLMRLVGLMKENKEYLADIISQETAKPITYALGETERAIQTFIIAAEESRRISGEQMLLDWTPAGNRKEGIIKYFPIGLVAGIAPFNFPLNLACHKLAPAIATGCPIILKPAGRTPLSVLALAELIDKAGVPHGAVSILPMDRETGDQLVTDPRFALLSFTGSPEVGWDMKNRAGKKRVVLELGGNAGVIISSSANIGLAVSKCVTGAFAFSGQVCIHTQRIYVQRTKFDHFIESFIKATAELKSGHPSDPETNISAVIDESNAIRVETWIKEAIHGGADLLYGGRRSGTFIEPTILTNTSSSMKVCYGEIFGPVVIIEPFDEFQEAIALINDSRYGLQAGVFTDALSEMNQAFDEIETGGVIINDVPTFRVDHMPYGGVKDSGTGREGIRFAMHDMLEQKILVKPF